MRIVALTILFAGLFFFFKREEKVAYPVKELDSIKVKASAPHRIERKVAEAPVVVEKISIPADVEQTPEIEEDKSEISNSEEPNLEHVDQFDDLEEGWNNELKDMLTRLEPADGETIHKNYLAEQESYQAEMESLLNEKQQKTTPEATFEVDELIYQLDEKHQTRLKDILGAHYEAVRDGLEHYMNQSQPE